MRRIGRVGLAVGLFAVLPASALACSMTSLTSLLPRDFVYFVGAARADTLAVSAVEPPVDALGRPWYGPWDPPRFGQAARVSRLGSSLDRDNAATLDAALTASDSVVVLVPWGITTWCARAPWRASVRWIRPGAEGLFRGRLRAPSAWVGGVPTLDVILPSAEPYPGGPTGDTPRVRVATPGPWLTAAELLGLFQALPTEAAMRRAPEEATLPLRRWVEANSALASRYPATDIVRGVRWAAHYSRVRLTPLPLAGTYHFTVRLSDGQSFSFYARTEPAPASTWHDARLAEGADTLPWARDSLSAPTGYDAEIVVARSERDLPSTRVDAERRQQPRFTFRIAASPVEERGGAPSWGGAVDFAGEALPVLATDAASRARLHALAERAREVSSLADPRSLPAAFRRLANGRVEVTQQFRLRDGRLLTIRGVRVSDVTVAPFE